MNHLLAKTRGVKGLVFKVLSGGTYYSIPSNFAGAKPYDPAYKLEEDEWFLIKKFSKQSFNISLISDTFVSTAYNQLAKDDYGKIQFLCAVQPGYFIFQKVSSGQLIVKRFLSLSDTPELIDDTPMLVLRDYPDAFYDRGADILYFKNLSSIGGIFKGIDELYREATDNETETFLSNDFIILGDEYNFESVKKANRKRIALAVDTLNKFTPEIKNKIVKYIRGYSSLEYDKKGRAFKIQTEEHLKTLLYGIGERFYTTQVNNEKRLANSVTKIE